MDAVGFSAATSGLLNGISFPPSVARSENTTKRASFEAMDTAPAGAGPHHAFPAGIGTSATHANARQTRDHGAPNSEAARQRSEQEAVLAQKRRREQKDADEYDAARQQQEQARRIRELVQRYEQIRNRIDRYLQEARSKNESQSASEAEKGPEGRRATPNVPDRAESATAGDGNQPDEPPAAISNETLARRPFPPETSPVESRLDVVL